MPLFYYPNIFPNTHLTSGPMKNTCKISAAGKHTAAVDIQRINQPCVPPWINAAAKVMTGTTHITVKHCTASIKNMGLSAAGSKSLRANKPDQSPAVQRNGIDSHAENHHLST